MIDSIINNVTEVNDKYDSILYIKIIDSYELDESNHLH